MYRLIPLQDDAIEDDETNEAPPVEFVTTIQSASHSIVQPQAVKAARSPVPSTAQKGVGALTPHSRGSIVPYSPSEDGSVATTDGVEV